MIDIVTRIAPSPTGDPHIGTAYVALLNYLFAKKYNGKFILRIEDTDQARRVIDTDKEIINAIRWLGLEWDEGPENEGENGPYYQSERKDIYEGFGELLIESGHAFKCYCSVDRLENMRSEQRKNKLPTKYDGHCLSLSADEIKTNEKTKKTFVVRQKIPENGTIIINDGGPREPIIFDAQNIDMQVLVKNDGMPTYHLANVVDDHLMGVSHVMRGEEWLSSAPKHQLLYDAFGWEMPTLVHLPLLRNPDRSKLSKRKNPTSINYYRRMGYLPEALLSYLFSLAMPVAEDGEVAIYTIDEMVHRFDISKLSLSGPVFDVQKLDWVNAKFIREKLSLEEYQDKLQEWAINSDFLKPIAAMSQTRIKRFSDLGDLAAHFFSGGLDLSATQILNGGIQGEKIRKFLFFALDYFETLSKWNSSEIELCLRRSADAVPEDFRKLVKQVFIVMSGDARSLPLFSSMEHLGKDITRARFRNALNTLGKPTNKEMEKWRAVFRDEKS